MTTTQTTDNGKPPVWLQSAGIIAGIISTLVITLTALAAVIHFTIRADVTPALIRLEDRQVRIEEQQVTVVNRLDGIDQRLDRIEALLTKK